MDDLKLFEKTKRDMESLMNTVRLFSEDIGMQFGVDKCAITALKRGKHYSSKNDIIFENQDTIRSLDEKNCYKYLGILEVDNIKHQQVKSQFEKKRIRKTAEEDSEIKLKFRQPGDGNKQLGGVAS